MLPSTLYQRLSHTPFEAQDAEAELGTSPSRPDLSVYTVRYPGLDRTLAITFRRQFPHEVEGWEERYVEFGRPVVTRAVRQRSRRMAYWTLNGPGDGAWRDSLGLAR